jgi:RNA polymerase sigma-70 factor, ECF subfamily
MTLNAAMNRYADGDNAAFSEVYDQLAPRLYAFLFRHTRNETHVEDLLQQTLLQMHCARGTFKEGADVIPWAFAIAKRLFIDGVRRKRHEVSLSHDGGEPQVDEALCSPACGDQLVYAKELCQSMADKLARTPERLRAAFRLVKVEGLSPEEAAQVLGSTAGAIRVRVHRARQMLVASEQSEHEQPVLLCEAS